MHEHPGIIMLIMQSQQLWIIFSIILSPLVHIIMHPISMISILHMPIMPMLQQHMHMPFIIMQQQTEPPAIIMHRFFIISALVLSSAVHIIFIPPAHFSIFIMQRGAMPMPIPIPTIGGIIICGMPGIIRGIPWGIISDIIPGIIIPPIGIWPIIPVIPRSLVIVMAISL
jgi:hypothetical protein